VAADSFGIHRIILLPLQIRYIRGICGCFASTLLGCAEDSAHYSQQRALLFFQSGDGMRRVFLRRVTVQRWADAQKKFKCVAQIVSIVAVEAVRAIIDCKLGAEADIKPVAMRQIADVTNRVTAHRKDARFIGRIENQFVAGFFHALPTRINRIASTLII